MNTVLMENELELPKNFTWKDIFSDMLKKHTKEQKNKLLMRGMGDMVPTPQKMLQEWQKPWLFLRVGIVAFLLMLLTTVSYDFFSSYAAVVLLMVIPAIVVPLAVSVFFWEMNIPGDCSVTEVILMVIVGGLLSMAPIELVRNLLPEIVVEADAAFLSGPIPEEITKFLTVLIILSRKKYRYGLHGLLVGAAVGCGFEAFENMGYALNTFMDYGSDYIMDTQLHRATWMSIGGHVVWASMYGGALGLAKSKVDKGWKIVLDPLFLSGWCGAVLLHTIWNLGASDLSGALPYGFVRLWNVLEVYYIKYIITIILAWSYVLFILRKSIRQVVAVSGYVSGQVKKQEERVVAKGLLTVQAAGRVLTGRNYTLHAGQNLIFGRDANVANVVLPADTVGVSRLHCEIKEKQGYLVLIDRGSKYGTYVENGRRLEPNVPYILQSEAVFYLASEENMFYVRINK